MLADLGPKHDAEAAKWYRKAAEQGVADAQHNLGVVYLYGHGMAQDNVSVHLWFSLAVSQGHEYAAKGLETLAPRMSSAEISKAEQLAREWLEKHGKTE